MPDTITNYNTFIQNNVNVPIKVIPHGIDPEVFSIQERTLTDKFYFLHIGSPVKRKGGQLVVDAFIDLFNGRDDIKLIIKSIGDPRLDFHGTSLFQNRQIIFIPNEISEINLAAIYGKAHCLVYPTNGEGFGLIPYQAIATGLPTIVTNLTACKSFAELSMPLNADWVEINPDEYETHYPHLGLWGKPDMDHLKELMVHIVNDWEKEKRKAVQGAHIIHASRTWNNIAELITFNLGDKLEYDE